MSTRTCRIFLADDDSAGVPGTLVRRGRGGADGDVVRLTVRSAKKLLRHDGKVRVGAGVFAFTPKGSGDTDRTPIRRGKVVLVGYSVYAACGKPHRR